MNSCADNRNELAGSGRLRPDEKLRTSGWHGSSCGASIQTADLKLMHLWKMDTQRDTIILVGAYWPLRARLGNYFLFRDTASSVCVTWCETEKTLCFREVCDRCQLQFVLGTWSWPGTAKVESGRS